MNEPLHPAQLRAFEKLKHLRVGALYIERQDGKLRTALELVRYRLGKNRADSVLWLCTRRRVELIRGGLAHHAPDVAGSTEVLGIESLSHNLGLFTRLMERAGRERMMLVIDNGLLIKNGAARRTQRVLALSARCHYRLLISDVPFMHSVADMFTQWYALDWRILGYKTYWGFCVNHLSKRGNGLNVDYLIRAIEPYCAQILREDVQPAASKAEYVWKFELPCETMAEYRRVIDAFIWKAAHTSTGVYRLLQACQHVVCGRRVVQDYPLVTEPMYGGADSDPRLAALMDVLERTDGSRVMILCRYIHECATVSEALGRRYGAENVGCYPEARRFMVMNVFADEREAARLRADVMIYYSSDWNWRKRQEKERQCRNALAEGTLTVVSLVAADTIDMMILKCIWNKDNLISQLRAELTRGMQGDVRRRNDHAKDI